MAQEFRAQTEELQATGEALRQSEQQWRRILEANPLGVVLGDTSGRVLEANEAYLRIIGRDREDLEAGRIFWDWITPEEYLPRDVQAIAEAQTTGVSATYEEEYLRLDGRRVPVLMAWATVGGKGQLAAFVLDITERKRAEEALRELNATLESRVAQRTAELKRRARQLQKMTLDMSEAEDRERARLAEILHDDLQQVLAAAKFHLSLMRNQVGHDPSLEPLGTEIDEMLKEAMEKSRSLSHELSPAVLHHGDFAEVLERLANQVQAKHGLVVNVRAHGQLSLQSDTIKAFVYKVACELLFNVVKHARVHEARIRVRWVGRHICLSVSDRGRGFDVQELGRTAGFGLLSIRERIELLGGRMKVKSAMGKGSTFLIAVPDGEVEPELNGRAQSQDTDRLRVLLADDHEIVREGLASLLSEESGIEVIGGASNGREAVALADRLEPDVVIMDVSMPLMSGDEATRQIKQHRPNTRVVALSMSVDPDTAQRMHAAGAEAYVLKTAPSEELLAAIRGD